MAYALEEMGVRVLINGATEVQRADASISIIGVDDPYDCKCDDLESALAPVPTDRFKILLAHAPELYDHAAEQGIHLYLCGHTHAGERTKLQVFAMRSMANGAAFHCAFAHATQQAFLEAHQLAFCFFHGVFRKLRHDNLRAAVKKIFQGYRREETARFIAFRSHWRFHSESCTPAEAHEKGGRGRRSWILSQEPLGAGSGSF